VDAWYSTLRVAEVAFDDQPRAFSNINTPEELHAIERRPRA
jgi:molybdopterin-guanine dinucleotide biosynthesis protein A